jgi:Right handed beta helix region
VKNIKSHAYIIGALILAYAMPMTMAAVDFQAFPSGPQPAAILSQIQEMRSRGQIPPGESAKIILHNGTYQLAKPIELRAEDSGTETGPLIIEAASGEHPVLSGGIEITGWTQITKKVSGLPAVAKGKIWVADVPKINGAVLNFRQLWVNGQKAIRAREPNGEDMGRIVAWNKTNQTAVIPAIALRGIKNPNGLEMVVDQVWEIAVLRVKSIKVKGSNAFVTFQQPESKIEFMHPWPPVIVNANYQAPFFLVNSIRFLDSPGEWFEDLQAGKVFYWPRDGEDMTHAAVVAPAAEMLVKMEGSLDHPVSNVQFEDITFAYTTWLRPSKQGHVPLQAGMFMLDAHKLVPPGMPYHRKLDNVAWIGCPPGAVSVENADRISFEGCVFENTASAGLVLKNGVHDSSVQGCTFRDIGGNGIQLGNFSDTNVETHTPWNPVDLREVSSHQIIANNIVSECGEEDWGCCGIAAGYVRDMKIEHNEVSDLPYTGISVGWGWIKMANAMENNFIFANHVHNVGRRLGDLGGIYTLSMQPGTVIAENAIENIAPGPYVPDPKHWFYIYLDEGSSFITVRDNWCPSEKFLRNANGPGNIWTNNGPQVSKAIKKVAGLEPQFHDLLIQPSQ